MRFAALLPVLFAVGCGLFGDGSRPAPSSPVIPASSPADGVTPEAPSVVTGSPTAVPAAEAAARDLLISAFETDCSYVPEVPVATADGDGRAKACHAIDFDQMCSSDRTGCHSELERCREECGNPCDSCSTSCADSCRDCKTACAGQGPGCTRACAEGRFGCHEGCVSNRKECFEVACMAIWEACGSRWDEHVKAECADDCAAYGDCLLVPSGTDRHAECAAKMPKLSEFCKSACDSSSD